MWTIRIVDNRVVIGERFAISFQRTLRIPDDGKAYPLPPSLGKFPVQRVEDYQGHLPASWVQEGGVFIPMYQREALWLAFEAASWKPNAVKIGIGRVNALTGGEWSEGLRDDPQDYLVCPEQPWLDGINSGDGAIRQFVAMPLGQGYTVEAQITGREQFGGLQVLVYDPKPGRFPDQPPPAPESPFGPVRMMNYAMAGPPPSLEMGVGAGGQIVQKVYPDPYGLETWDQTHCGNLFVHIVNSLQYEQITGCPLPPSPVNAKTYTEYGFPWFELYDEAKDQLTAGEKLKEVKSVRQLDEQKGVPHGVDETSFEVGPGQIEGMDPEQIEKSYRQSTGYEE